MLSYNLDICGTKLKACDIFIKLQSRILPTNVEDLHI